MFPSDIQKLAETLLQTCRERQLRIVTAESCTGGLIGGALTEVAGSSDVFERGFITYSNMAKQQNLDVPADLFDTVGAVSHEVAEAMAEGALQHAQAQVAIAVTGVAGPGASENKPAGLVYIACAVQDGPIVVQENRFVGDRSAVRLETVRHALRLTQGTVAPDVS